MRVLHVLRVVYPQGAGVQSYLASVAAALHESPVRLVLGCLWPGQAPGYPADLRHMGSPGVSRVTNVLAFWRWLRQDVPRMDVVHIHNIYGLPLLLGALACRFSGVPYVVSPHGRLVAEAQAEMDWRHRLYLKLVVLPILRRAACLVGTTESDRADLTRLDNRLRVAVVPPGLPFDSKAELPKPQGAALRIAFVGRLLAVKNVPTLLRAAAILRDRGVDVRVDIIGWSQDDTAKQLQALAGNLGLQGLVRFHGKLHGEAKDAMVRAAHVAAVPSLRENFSFATAEALVMGIPVVISATVGLAPVVTKYRCGVAVPPTDATAWADALQEFADPARRELYVAQARECAVREFSLTAMRDALVRTYTLRLGVDNRQAKPGTTHGSAR